MFIPNCQVPLYRSILQTDGTSLLTEKGVFSAFFMEHYRTKKEGDTEDLSEILLVPEAHPEPGDVLELNGIRRNIARVRSCTDARGSIRCYRCAFLRF